MSRFNYVKYDSESAAKQEALKAKFQELEILVESDLQPGRAKALVLTKLEEAYMWTGKDIRDQQIARDSQTAHEPARSEQ